MNFEDFINDDKKNYDRIKHLGESQIKSGADVARELGITRAAVKKSTQRSISKIYNVVDTTLNKDSGPLKNVVYIAYLFGVENDQKGLQTIYNNLSPEQKAAVIADVEKNYPGYLKLIGKGA